MIDKLRSKIYNLLKKSEKFFQTDMVYLAKGGFWLTLGQIISSLSSFLLAIAFANLLPKEVYGTYKYVLSLVGMLSIFTLSGMGTSLTRSTARGFEGSVIPILKEKIKWGAFGSLVSLGIAIYYYLNGNLTLTICFVIAAIFLPLMDSFGIYGAFLNGRKNFKLSTKYNIIIKIIATTLMILVLIFSKNVFLILFAYFISYTSLRFIFLKITIKKERPNSETESDTMSYGKHLSLMNVILTIANNIDKILLWHFLGAVSLAIYSFAIAIPEQARTFFRQTSILAFPKLANKSINEIKKTFLIKIQKYFLILVPLVGLYIIIAPYIYKMLFPQYTESIIYSQIFILIILFTPISHIQTVLTAHTKKKQLYILKVALPFLRIILLLLLLPFYGIMGAILAIIGTHIIRACILLFFFKKL